MSDGRVRLLYFCMPLLILSLMYHAPLHAAGEVTEIQLDNVRKGTVALGFGRRFGDSPYEEVIRKGGCQQVASSYETY